MLRVGRYSGSWSGSSPGRGIERSPILSGPTLLIVYFKVMKNGGIAPDLYGLTHLNSGRRSPPRSYSSSVDETHAGWSSPDVDNLIQQAFGDRVRELRERRGWTQEKLADQCGLHRTYIWGIEQGRRNPSLVNIVKIAQALGVKIGELFD
jgi:DNA-binding XRE family transcriptional regulator